MNTFLKQQQDLDTSGLLEASLVLNLPTGNGKTTLAFTAVKAALEHNERVIYVCPLRGIANQVFEAWSKQLEVPVGVYSGEYSTPPVPFEDARVLILTIERLELCTRFWLEHFHWISEVGLLVVDEVHLLSEERRGFHLESAISRIRRLNPLMRTLALSATLGNPEVLGEWLDARVYRSTERAVPQEWSFLEYGSPREQLQILAEKLRERDKNPTIVFVNSRRRAQQLAERTGALLHHAGLSREKRLLVESQFMQGEKDVLVATSTLAQGLNLPAKRVVLFDLEQYRGAAGYQPISVVECHQRAGRAGRAGMHPVGHVVVMHHWKTDPDLLKKYRRGEFEPTLSTLSREGHLQQWVLAEVAAKTARTYERLLRAHKTTLDGFTDHGAEDIHQALSDLRSAGLLRQQGGGYSVTREGYIMMRHMLQLPTVQLSRLVRSEHTVFDLLLLAVLSPDCRRLYVQKEQALQEQQLLQQTPSQILGPDTAGTLGQLQDLGFTEQDLQEATRTALMLLQVSASTTPEETARGFHCTEVDARSIGEEASRVLDAFHAVLEDTGQTRTLKLRLKLVGKMARYLLSREAATLTLIEGVGGKTVEKLLQVGIQDIEDLANSNPSELEVKGVSLDRLAIWIQRAEELIDGGFSAFFLRDDPTRLKPLEVLCPDEYRLYRAQELTVTPTSQGFVVTGGSMPHRTTLETCDCLDFAAGHTCKHILAVRLHMGGTCTLMPEEQPE